jgi:mono/diheme cytochrome c family protein
MSMKLLLLGCFVIASAWCQKWNLLHQVPAKAAAKRNPIEGNERARRAGAKLFARECSACHGLNAEGSDNAPPLQKAEVQQAPAGTLFWILENGSLHHGMPSFAHLPEPQRWQIIIFLHSLSQKED